MSDKSNTALDQIDTKIETSFEVVKPSASGSSMTKNDPSIAEKSAHQRRIIAEDPGWNLAPVEKLSNLCVKTLNPILKGLPHKFRNIVISSISTEIPLAIAGPLIPDEEYWKRRSKDKFKLTCLQDHGSSWKRLFFELHLKKEIETFSPGSENGDAKLTQLYSELALGAPFVECLKLSQLLPVKFVKGEGEEEKDALDMGTTQSKNTSLDHLDLGLALANLKNLRELSVYYGMKDCGIEFSWAYFGMTMKDAISLSNGLKIFRLEKLIIQASGIDDDNCRLICHALLSNETVTSVDFSHNKIGDSGARGLAKLLASPSCQLSNLKLANNQISFEGAKSLGKALQINKTLLSLDLRLNHLYDEGGHSILTLLAKNATLRVLDLSGNGLELKSVEALTIILKLNIASLTKLDLSCNKLGDYTGEKRGGSEPNIAGYPAKTIDGAGKSIFEAISQNKYLTSFDLRTTGISPDFLIGIQGIVSENGV